MIPSKKEIMERNLIRNFISESQFQPCGVDLTLKSVRSFFSKGKIDYDNSERRISEVKELKFDKDGWIRLEKGAYKIIYNEVVKVPPDMVAIGFSRSSLLRCGAHVECAVWDPGYEGRSESLLVVENPHGLMLKRNARVVQLIFIPLTSPSDVYSGRYQRENL